MRPALLTLSLATLASVAPAAPLPRPQPDETAPSILELAVQANEDTGEFSTLIAAVLYTGLDPVLDAKRQLTVFAPTDAAFAELGLDASNVASMPVEDVAAILLHHVAAGRRASTSLLSAKRVRMLDGGFTEPSLSSGVLSIDDAQVVMADLGARNGVVHVIDAVLLP